MKKEEKKVVRESYVTTFVAIDGTEFNSQQDCEKYEKSVECSISVRLNDITVNRMNQESVFLQGNEDCDCHVPEGLNGRSIENLERFKEILANSGITYNDKLSYKNGSRYLSFPIKDRNGYYISIRVRFSDHAQPKEWGKYEEGVNDFRNYADAYKYLSRFFDLSDKRNVIIKKRKELAEQVEEVEWNGEKSYRIKGKDAVFSTPDSAVSNLMTAEVIPRMTGQLVDEFKCLNI